MKKINWNFLYIVLPILLVAGLGAVFVNLGMSWFDGLNKPSQWIPNWVIPIVWTIAYLGFAVILIIMQNKYEFSVLTKVLLIVNGVLNILWCLVFFTLNLTLLGDVIIIANLIAGFWLVLDISKYNKIHSYILAIYPLWLSIATTLNLAMWILN